MPFKNIHKTRRWRTAKYKDGCGELTVPYILFFFLTPPLLQRLIKVNRKDLADAARINRRGAHHEFTMRCMMVQQYTFLHSSWRSNRLQSSTETGDFSSKKKKERQHQRLCCEQRERERERTDERQKREKSVRRKILAMMVPNWRCCAYMLILVKDQLGTYLLLLGHGRNLLQFFFIFNL